MIHTDSHLTTSHFLMGPRSKEPFNMFWITGRRSVWCTVKPAGYGADTDECCGLVERTGTATRREEGK